MDHDQSTDRAAIRVEIDRLHQLETKTDSSIGQGITRRIQQLQQKLEYCPEQSDVSGRAA